jgi:hypothetical protein
LSDYNQAKDILNIEITSIKAGNSDKNGAWLTRPGTSLSAVKMRYLKPVITYNSNVSMDSSITFYWKIIKPNGQLNYNSSISPKNFTYKDTAYINRGTNQSLEFSGWGNSDESSYWAGNWTVEIWYKDVCLKSEKIYIGY